jgi:hypothetical protein
MAEQILVPLKRNDRVEEMIPYIEKVTRLGMGVVFLAPLSHGSFYDQLPRRLEIA